MSAARRATTPLGVLLAGLAALAACHAPAPPAPSPAATARPRVVLESPSGRSSAVEVELARTPAEQERGLMHREKLGAGEGMLFVFPDLAPRSFWMKDTLIPLDMIFVGDGAGGALEVVGVVARAEPLTTTPRAVPAPSRYVLEVNGGWAAAHGVAAGDRVRVEGVGR